MNQQIESTTLSGNETATPPEQTAATHQQFARTERLDLSHSMRDKSLSLHGLSRCAITLQQLSADVHVFDLDHVYATTSAKTAIERAYLTALYLVEQYARHYMKAVFRPVTRGNDKGCLILDESASKYVHPLGDGSTLIVKGATIKLDGHTTRTLTISCGDATGAGGAA